MENLFGLWHWGLRLCFLFFKKKEHFQHFVLRTSSWVKSLVCVVTRTDLRLYIHFEHRQVLLNRVVLDSVGHLKKNLCKWMWILLSILCNPLLVVCSKIKLTLTTKDVLRLDDKTLTPVTMMKIVIIIQLHLSISLGHLPWNHVVAVPYSTPSGFGAQVSWLAAGRSSDHSLQHGCCGLWHILCQVSTSFSYQLWWPWWQPETCSSSEFQDRKGG